eukprot:8577835-Pyramimonas_sp.AAC.1
MYQALVVMRINVYKSRVRACVGGGGAGMHCEGLKQSVVTTWRQRVAVAIRWRGKVSNLRRHGYVTSA